MAETASKSAQELERYLDPSVIGRIQKLDLRTRLVVEGFITGLHRSPYQGLSVEFAQHREYVPGDDVKHVDWKVYSRSDRYYIKQYEEETNLRCTFLVDASESMRYAGAARRTGEGLDKFHYAACVAAALSLLLLRQQDAVGLATFDEDLRPGPPPSANPSQIKAIVHHLDQASHTLAAKTSLEDVCHKAAEKIGKRGMVCLISDLLGDEDGLMRGLQHLAHRGHDVMVIHVMDEDELTFPFDGNTRFRGMEAMGELVGEPRALRQGYLESLNSFLDDIRRRCIANRVGYALVSTSDHLAAVLAEFLARRADAGRKGSSKRR